MINTLTLAGALVGAALPYYFSGLLIESVAKAAGLLVKEVRRQFKEIPGILTGESKPDYKLCIEISSAGAWDNAKKLVESGGVPGHGKGSDLHSSTVIGDTVGDPLKDTVGPSLDILIKIMAMVSLVFVSVFSQYNILNLFN